MKFQQLNESFEKLYGIDVNEEVELDEMARPTCSVYILLRSEAESVKPENWNSLNTPSLKVTNSPREAFKFLNDRANVKTKIYDAYWYWTLGTREVFKSNDLVLMRIKSIDEIAPGKKIDDLSRRQVVFIDGKPCTELWKTNFINDYDQNERATADAIDLIEGFINSGSIVYQYKGYTPLSENIKQNVYDNAQCFQWVGKSNESLSEEFDDELDEGIFDTIKSKINDLKVNKGYNDDYKASQASRREFDARRAANATQSPDKMLDADREAQNRIEYQHQADLKRAKKQANGIEDEVMRKAQANKAYADEKRQAAQMHKQDVSTFMANASKSMSKIKNKATLDAMYYDYLDAMRKSSKGGLKYSDPMYKELTKEYQTLRSKLKK